MIKLVAFVFLFASVSGRHISHKNRLQLEELADLLLSDQNNQDNSNYGSMDDELFDNLDTKVDGKDEFYALADLTETTLAPTEGTTNPTPSRPEPESSTSKPKTSTPEPKTSGPEPQTSTPEPNPKGYQELLAMILKLGGAQEESRVLLKKLGGVVGGLEEKVMGLALEVERLKKKKQINPLSILFKLLGKDKRSLIH